MYANSTIGMIRILDINIVSAMLVKFMMIFWWMIASKEYRQRRSRFKLNAKKTTAHDDVT